MTTEDEPGEQHHVRGGAPEAPTNSTAAVEDEAGPLLHGNSEDPRRRRFESVKGLFVDIFANATICNIDPLRCISLPSLRAREIIRFAVERLKATISGESDSESLVRGFIATGKFGVVTKVPREYRDLVEAHWKDQGKSEEEARGIARAGPWYHVIDGGQVHKALLELIEESSERFGGFRWPVVVVEWQPPDTLLAISRMCQEMQRDEHTVDFPVPDVMRNLRYVIDSYTKRNGIALVPGQKLKPGFVKDVLTVYTSGEGYASSTLKNLCYVIVRLSTTVVQEIARLLTEECDAYSRQLGGKRPFPHDTRVYKKLLSTKSLKGARRFLDPKETTDEDRINVVHRLRFIAKERESFNAFQASDIDEQTRRVISARTQISVFQKFLGEDTWPTGMQNLRTNMLKTTLVDEEIEKAADENDDLLPVLVESYVRTEGIHGRQRVNQFRRMKEREVQTDMQVERSERSLRSKSHAGVALHRQSQADSNSATDGEERIGLTDGGGGAHQSSSGCEDPSLAADPQEGSGENRSDVPRAEGTGERRISSEVGGNGDEINVEEGNASGKEQLAMERCKASIFEKTILQYEMDISNCNAAESIDFVLADPFQKVPDADTLHMDEKDVTSFVQCARRLLVPGGFCFVFLQWSKLPIWASTFATNEMEVICDPFLIMRDASRFQKLNVKGLQNAYEPAMVARKTGRHPKDFSIDKKSPYTHIPSCRMPRWCNAIDGVPSAQDKLMFKPSKALVRPNERSPSLVMEILQTFCPSSGRVLDPFAGALTTGISCIVTERECILLETDKRCLSQAVPRLENFAESKILSISPPAAVELRDSEVERDLERTGDEETESGTAQQDKQALDTSECTRAAESQENGTAQSCGTPPRTDLQRSEEQSLKTSTKRQITDRTSPESQTEVQRPKRLRRQPSRYEKVTG